MGSYTTLGIGNIEIDWQKNHITNNHSRIFQGNNFKKMNLPYDEDYDTEEIVYKEEEVLARPLGQIKRRLDLLGYTLNKIEEMYNEDVKHWEDYYSNDAPLTFERFVSLVKSFDLENAKPTFDFVDNGYDPGELVSGDVFRPENTIDQSISISKDDGLFFENLDPYVALKLLSENPENDNREVVWSFMGLVNGGWVDENSIFEELSSKDKILIVTEGSTDTNILRKSIDILAPDVCDFFNYIDMKDNYPFTGTGSLLNFCKGLASIQVQNKILVVLDNDVAGVKTLKRIEDLKLPLNLVAITLPEIEGFNKFKTIGTDGESLSNINGKAVSIECFLDLNFKKYEHEEEPRIRWSNYDEELNCYHGALEHKESFIKKFFTADLAGQEYNTEKLKILTNYIIKKSSELVAQSK